MHGFLADRLLDVWLAQQDYRVKELPVAHLERQHWGRKIAAFLLRKMGHQKRPNGAVKRFGRFAEKIYFRSILDKRLTKDIIILS